jgi:tetratricopeptide (TPR) repeat protein
MNKTEFKMNLCAKCRRWADHELKVRPGSAEECFYLAEGWFTLGGFDQAIPLYREAIRLAPRHEALYHHCLSTALYRLGKSDEGEQEMVLATAYSNDSSGFNYNFGVRSLRDDPQLAEEYFAKALAVAQNPQKIHRLIGQAYRAILHDVERAARHYKEYLKLGGNDQDVKDWLESRSQLYLI